MAKEENENNYNLYKKLRDKYLKLGKFLDAVDDPKAKLDALVKFARIILEKGKPLSMEGVEIREIIFHQLKTEYKRFNSYLFKDSAEKELKIIMQFTNLLTLERQEALINELINSLTPKQRKAVLIELIKSLSPQTHQKLIVDFKKLIPPN